MTFRSHFLFLSVPSLLLASPLAAEGLKSCDDFCMCNPGPACFLSGTPQVSLLNPDTDKIKPMNFGSTPAEPFFASDLEKAMKADQSTTPENSTGSKDIGDISQVLPQAVADTSNNTSNQEKISAKAALAITSAVPGSYTNPGSKGATNWSKFYKSKPTDFANLSLVKDLSKNTIHGNDEDFVTKANFSDNLSPEQKQKKADFSVKGEHMTPKR